VASSTAAAWVSQVAAIGTWDAEKATEFAIALEGEPEGSIDRRNILDAMDVDAIVALHNIDKDAWKRVAAVYSDYAQGWFLFVFASTVGDRLRKFFDLGGPAVRKDIAVALAVLGDTHNRWSVMTELFDCCGHAADDASATRIAMHIVSTETRRHFLRCAEELSRKPEVFHPTIRDALRAT
jgi:hypothetical protein